MPPWSFTVGCLACGGPLALVNHAEHTTESVAVVACDCGAEFWLQLVIRPMKPAPTRTPKERAVREHGTRYCYEQGCRQPACVTAARDYRRRYRRRRAGVT